jgi:hypothetical protein
MKQTKQRVLSILALAGLITLLVTCDGFISPEPDTAELVDGKVNLTIKTDYIDARALWMKSAQDSVNFYEVIFFNTSENAYFRTAWYKGQPAKLAIPPADYNGTAGKAILLAGTNNAGTAADFTLLAVGRLTEVTHTSGPATTTEVKSNSTKVKFTLLALEAAPTKDPTTTAFKIIGPTTTPGDYQTVSIAPANLPTATIDSNNNLVPLFNIPKDTAIGTDETDTIMAAYTIARFTESADSVATFGEYVVVKGTGVLTPVGVASTTSQVDAALFENASIENADGDPLDSGKITMKLATPDEDGLCVLFFDLPVSGLDAAAKGLTWHLRGGIDNTSLDRIKVGPDKTDTNYGGILLGIGAVSGPIIIDTMFP